jgi:uncharacterized Zn finger protein (UPF0148 family)
MATKVIVCPECESPLVQGRFSCQSCGVVVAAVASDARTFARAEPAVPPVLEPAAPEPELAESRSVAADDEVDALDAAPVDERIASAADGNGFDAATVAAEPQWPSSSAQVAAAAEPQWPSWTGQAPAEPQWPSPNAQAAAPAAPSWPDQPAWPPVRDAPVTPESPQRTPAGAYLPPSAVLPPGDALPAGKSGSGDESGSRRSLAERFALGDEDGPLGLAATLPGRTIALGAAIAGLGFLLPWAEIVIGSAGIGGFLDQWGLAGPGHWVMLLLLFAVGGLAVAGERTSVRVGTSTAAIVVGALLLGLAFPYVMGPFREAVGVYVTLTGALVMIAGGLLARAAPLARAAQRHDPAAESV